MHSPHKKSIVKYLANSMYYFIFVPITSTDCFFEENCLPTTARVTTKPKTNSILRVTLGLSYFSLSRHHPEFVLHTTSRHMVLALAKPP